MSDPALIEALLARVPGAGRTFIAYQDAFVRKSVLCASPAAVGLVDDLTHDVYVHLWRDDFRVLRQWRRQHPLQAYLRLVVTRLVWDRLSRVRPAWEQVDADPHSVAGADAATCDASPTPEEEVAANELYRMVRDALERLGANHCRVLELRYVRDLSYCEIGDTLGITANSAGVRINRALSRLKAALPHLIDATAGSATSGPVSAVGL